MPATENDINKYCAVHDFEFCFSLFFFLKYILLIRVMDVRSDLELDRR